MGPERKPLVDPLYLDLYWKQLPAAEENNIMRAVRVNQK